MFVKLYNCYIKKTVISYPKKVNNLAEKLADEKIIEESTNEEISTPFDNPDPQKLC